MGPEAVNGEGVGQIPPQGGRQADREATAERMGRRVGLTTTEGCNGIGRLTGGGDLRLLPPEKSHTVYCDYANYGPVSDGEMEARTKGDK